MKKILMLMIVFSMFLTVSCNKKMIKGTNIEETPDSKEILTVFGYHSLEKVSMTTIIKDLFFNDAEDKAELIYFYEVRFKMKSSVPPTEENAFIQHDGMTNQKLSENNKMKFVKEDGKWKIVSGL